MEKKELVKFFSLPSGLCSIGVLTVKDNKAEISHTDTSNVAYVRCLAPFTSSDGQYGMEFGRVLTALKGAEKEVKLTFNVAKGVYTIQYGKTKHNLPTLDICTLPVVRPHAYENKEFPCIMELETVEFISIIETIKRNSNPQENEFIKVLVQYKEGELTLKMITSDPRDFVERSFELISVEKGRDGKYESLFSYDYMKIFSDALKELGCKSIRLCLGKDMPLYISAKDESTGIEVDYMLAPRIEGSN